MTTETVTDEIALPQAAPAKFAIYRAAEAPNFDELSCMELVDVSPVIGDGIERVIAEGFNDGNVVKMLFSMPGMSLTYAWFKSGFPLPLHSHNANCLYYIVAGSLKIGTEELGAGDGFFVGSDVPYAYKPGPQGVEVLEFRTVQEFDIRFLGKTKTFWDKTVESLRDVRPNWADEVRPFELARA